MLIDSNIIIYAAQPNCADLRHFIVENAPVTSAVSYVEVLGFHKLTETDRQHFTDFFAAATVLPITRPILDQAVSLRQIKKMTLGDSLIAATCLVHQLTLVTRNTRDFVWIPGLGVLDPLSTN
jgi:predicted nucleic acid-binding protein